MAYLSNNNIQKLLNSVQGVSGIYGNTYTGEWSKDSWDSGLSNLQDWMNGVAYSKVDNNNTTDKNISTSGKYVLDDSVNNYCTVSNIDDIKKVSTKAIFTTERLSEMVLSQNAEIKELREKLDKLYKILQSDRDEALLKEEKKDDSVFLEFFDTLGE